MGRSQESFGKKEREKKREKKRQEKLKKKEERKSNTEKKSWEDMIAYVDEFGNVTDTPPEEQEREEVNAEDIVIGVPKKEEDDDDGIYTGKVAFFNEDKGYGFIRDQRSQQQYFVHISGLIDEVRENDKVTFELEQGKKGLNAVRVKKA